MEKALEKLRNDFYELISDYLYHQGEIKKIKQKMENLVIEIEDIIEELKVLSCEIKKRWEIKKV